MRRLLFTVVALLLGCDASLAQVSTMGTTAMGLSSTPGAIVTSALNGPSPFSATTQSGTPDTTLAPVPNRAWNSGGAGYLHVGPGRNNRDDAVGCRSTDDISSTGEHCRVHND
jgi:hypothetical protein